ncbi:MAG: hypothetical protein NZM31_03060 [Gemmatales bacterium]|nr:hypothetical protein [Gemmatales bacterium]MDW8385980.1 hypothetical protein [Gemmatales bacterium]
MIPPLIRRQLAGLRRRERLLAFVWGVSQAVALAVVVFLFACGIDWLADRFQETPLGLRRFLLLAQAVFWGASLAVFVLWPLTRDLSDERLALWAEERIPDLGHRLISTVQFHRWGADLSGMSPALIAVTTWETEELVRPWNLADLADSRRLRWSGRLALGTLAVIAVALLIAGPETLTVLARRQFLAQEPIPRSISLASATPPVWPSGENVTLRFHVYRKPTPWGWPSQGKVRVYPEGGETEELVLRPAHFASDQEAVYEATVPAMTTDFRFRAWLGDGRMDEPGHVRFEPRPAVRKLEAWVQLPSYIGPRPDGSPYEEYQPRGEITGLFGSSARIRFETQKPILEATVEVLGHPAPEVLAWLPIQSLQPPAVALGSAWDFYPRLMALDLAGKISTLTAEAQNELGPEWVRREVPVRLAEDKQGGEAVFDLRPSETAYRVVVRDEYGFRNADPPRRGLSLRYDEPPVVELLPEHFIAAVGEPLSAETEVEGKPIPLTPGGAKVRIAYRAQDPYGLSRARLRYRIVRKEDPDNPTPWFRLPLDEVQAGEGVGPFDRNQGAFVNSGLDDQIEFYAEPSRDPHAVPGRQDGGGRFDFQVGALGLRVGDMIEFYVEVEDFNPDPERRVGRSEVRRKQIVTPFELTQWLLNKAEHERRLRDLERRQRAVPTGGEDR